VYLRLDGKEDRSDGASPSSGGMTSIINWEPTTNLMKKSVGGLMQWVFEVIAMQPPRLDNAW